MRILHFSDLHVGVENFGRVDPETGLSTRLLDFLETYDEVVDYAIDNGVDLVLFCGDAYKSRDPSQTHQREFARRIARLSAQGVPVFLLEGNHDIPNAVGRATALEIFRTLDVPNVYIGDSLRNYVVPTAGGPVQIVAVPWIRRAWLLSRDDTRRLTPEQVNEEIQKRLTDHIRARVAELDPDIPAVLAGHVTIGEAVAGSEQTMMLGRDHVLLKSSVALPQLDYVALGHIHRHQILGHDPYVVYSGSLQRIDFGEENQEKGFCVVEVDPAKPAGLRTQDFQFQPVNARTLLTVSATVREGDLDPTRTVTETIDGYHIPGSIVRLQIKVPRDLEGHLRDGEIRSALDEAHYVASISREVQQEHRMRLGQTYSDGLDPKEGLRLYLESRSVPADRAEVLMRHAEGLMEEEDRD